VLRAGLIAFTCLAAPERAWAHGSGPDGLDHVWVHWSLDPLVSLPVLVAGILYARGYASYRRRLGRRPAVLARLGPTPFLLGQIVIALALLSPLDAASGMLMSAHMVQHVLLVAVAPPLLLAGRPEAICAQGLPVTSRRALARHRAFRTILKGMQAMARPLPASILHGAALWLWHAPILFEAARSAAFLHALEHACFFGTALLFWRGIVGAARRPAVALTGAAAALITLVHSGFLSALIVLSPSVLYPASVEGAPAWGLTPLEDQQLAGAIMWVPAGAIYLIAGLALAARVLAPRRREPVRIVQVAAAERMSVTGS
jgi:putative membrane protein